MYIYYTLKLQPSSFFVTKSMHYEILLRANSKIKYKNRERYANAPFPDFLEISLVWFDIYCMQIASRKKVIKHAINCSIVASTIYSFLGGRKSIEI